LWLAVQVVLVGAAALVDFLPAQQLLFPALRILLLSVQAGQGAVLKIYLMVIFMVLTALIQYLVL
jgi:hypothetical protein